MHVDVSCFLSGFLYLSPDDEPEDGPAAYILLQGFTSPDLLTQLGSVGVPVNAIVKLSATDWDVPIPTESEQ